MMNNKLLIRGLAAWIGSLVLFSSCGNNPLKVDLSGIQITPVKIQRFDRDFFSLSSGNIEQNAEKLLAGYPGFAGLYINNIVCPGGSIRDSSCLPSITRFITDKDMKGAYDAAQSVFPDMSGEEAALTEIVRHYKYYFPHKPLPNIYAIMSGFNYSITTADTNFAIGLEMYLGNGHVFYKRLQIPAYKQFTMQKKFIPVDLARAWMMRDFPDKGKSGTLLNEMIYQGKLLYLADALMPEAEDTLKIEFTRAQMDWCIHHEKDIWGHLIQNKFLYSSEADIIAKFTGEGPFTTGFVKESPARTGCWLGWRIVKKYMEENPKTTLEQLMNENDAQILLSKSKYKP